MCNYGWDFLFTIHPSMIRKLSTARSLTEKCNFTNSIEGVLYLDPYILVFNCAYLLVHMFPYVPKPEHYRSKCNTFTDRQCNFSFIIVIQCIVTCNLPRILFAQLTPATLFLLKPTEFLPACLNCKMGTVNCAFKVKWMNKSSSHSVYDGQMPRNALYSLYMPLLALCRCCLHNFHTKFVWPVYFLG